MAKLKKIGKRLRIPGFRRQRPDGLGPDDRSVGSSVSGTSSFSKASTLPSSPRGAGSASSPRAAASSKGGSGGGNKAASPRGGGRNRSTFEATAAAALQASSSPPPPGLSTSATNSGSLDPEGRDHGPIDMDSCRKYKGGEGGTGTGAGKKRRNSIFRKGGAEGGGSGMPRIAESRSITPSTQVSGARSPSPADASPAPESESAPKSDAPAKATASSKSKSSEQPAPPTPGEGSGDPAAAEADDSPGADTVSTDIHGKDVFERSRSHLSSLVAGILPPSGKRPMRAQSTSPRMPRVGENAVNRSSSNSPYSPQNFFSRVRSGSPSVFDGLDSMETPPSEKSKGGSKGGGSGGGEEGEEVATTPKKEGSSIPPEASPTSVFVFDNYAVEVGGEGPEGGAVDQLKDASVQPPAMPSSSSGEANKAPRPPTPHPKKRPQSPSAVTGPPRLHRISPTAKMFQHSSAGGSHLEEAIAAYAAALGDSSVTSASLQGRGSSSVTGIASPKSLEFRALKKCAEKNEFRAAAVLLKGGSKPEGHPLPPSSLGTIPDSPREEIEVRPADPTSPRPSSAAAARSGAAATTAEPESPDPFATDEVPSSSAQRRASPSPGDESDIVLPVDVVESFSFQEELTSSDDYDDSLSYLSDLESIGTITICDETTRLLEQRERYEAEATTNPDHPARKSGTILKVGSKFRPDPVPPLSLSAPSLAAVAGRESPDGTLPSFANVPTDVTLLGSLAQTDTSKSSQAQNPPPPPGGWTEKKKLTWYDDEANWDKPFTLRTDESFDGSTVTSEQGGFVGDVAKGAGNVERIIRHNLSSNFLGDIMKGILPTCGGLDVADGEQEI
ncbi:hypothetical protein ACHAWF_007814 [Thalassiosira exigua]